MIQRIKDDSTHVKKNTTVVTTRAMGYAYMMRR
jgi:hypothetical protein